MKKVEEVLVPEDELAVLEKAHYEYGSIKDTISFMVDTHRADTGFLDSEIFKKYQEQLTEKFKAYEELKDDFGLKYVPEKYMVDGSSFMWEADFHDHKIIISEL